MYLITFPNPELDDDVADDDDTPTEIISILKAQTWIIQGYNAYVRGCRYCLRIQKPLLINMKAFTYVRSNINNIQER